MARINDLGLANEQVGQAIDYTTIPDQMGSFAPMLQPGTYRFKFPSRMDDIWEAIDHPNGNPPGKRVKAKFDDTHPLTILQSPGGVRDGEPFQTTLTNAERKRGKKDDAQAPYVSDMDYVFRDVFGLQTKPAGGNIGYAQELMKHVNEEFTADIEVSWFCNPNKNIYADNGQGGLSEMDQKGCGTRYYQKDVSKVPSDPNDPASPQIFPERITCQCGANLRGFAGLSRYRR